MLDFNFSEMAVVAVVALVVIGPKDLPKALRVVGFWVGKARGVARQFRAGFDEMVRESELAEMEKKWQAENERIMREHPVLAPDSAASPDSPALLNAPAAPPADVEAAPVEHEDAPPAMVEKPVVEPVAQAAPGTIDPQTKAPS